MMVGLLAVRHGLHRGANQKPRRGDMTIARGEDQRERNPGFANQKSSPLHELVRLAHGEGN
jgi:hypothetical protein